MSMLGGQLGGAVQGMGGSRRWPARDPGMGGSPPRRGGALGGALSGALDAWKRSAQGPPGGDLQHSPWDPRGGMHLTGGRLGRGGEGPEKAEMPELIKKGDLAPPRELAEGEDLPTRDFATPARPITRRR